MSKSSEGKCHYAAWLYKSINRLDLSNNVCEYEVNRLTNKKVI